MFCCNADSTENYDSILTNVRNWLINDSNKGYVTYLQFSPCFLAGTTSVSYTHLDVYKRQVADLIPQ